MLAAVAHGKLPPPPALASLNKAAQGLVTFAHFTCQPPCALRDGAKENQSFRALDVGVESDENGLFLANVTMPYGTTKRGGYMCEADAKAAGDRAAMNEKHP